jgi:hypothetical protein
MAKLFDDRVGDLTIPQLKKRLGWQDGPIQKAQLNAGSYPSLSVTPRTLNLPAARMAGGGTESFANGIAAVVTLFNSTTYDTHGMVDLTNNRVTAPEPGLYTVTASVTFAANTTGDRWLILDKDGVAYSSFSMPAPTISAILNMADGIQLNAGQYVSIRAYQSSGGALDLTACTLSLHFDTAAA